MLYKERLMGKFFSVLHGRVSVSIITKNDNQDMILCLQCTLAARKDSENCKTSYFSVVPCLPKSSQGPLICKTTLNILSGNNTLLLVVRAPLEVLLGVLIGCVSGRYLRLVEKKERFTQLCLCGLALMLGSLQIL